MIASTPFGNAGEKYGEITAYKLMSLHLTVTILTLGATIQSILLDGEEMVLGYETAKDYIEHGDYVGPIVGRIANRIENSRFTLGDREIVLTPNEGVNQLHGGPMSIDKRVWDVVGQEDFGSHGAALTLALMSPDGDNGFPGNLKMTACYRLVDNRLSLSLSGISDCDTVFAPTSHVFFSLGEENSVLNLPLWMNADRYLAVNDQLIPTQIQKAEGFFDFRKMKKISHPFDHAFVLAPRRLKNEASYKKKPVLKAKNGRVTLKLYSDFPAIQLYTGQKLNPPFLPYAGFACEAEMLPNACNHPGFLDVACNHPRFLDVACKHSDFGDVALPADEQKTYHIDWELTH